MTVIFLCTQSTLSEPRCRLEGSATRTLFFPVFRLDVRPQRIHACDIHGSILVLHGCILATRRGVSFSKSSRAGGMGRIGGPDLETSPPCLVRSPTLQLGTYNLVLSGPSWFSCILHPPRNPRNYTLEHPSPASDRHTHWHLAQVVGDGARQAGR